MWFKKKVKPIIVLPFWKASTTSDDQLRLTEVQEGSVFALFKNCDDVSIEYYSITGIGWNIYAVRGLKRVDITDFSTW